MSAVYTPEIIDQLGPSEVMVFGSNRDGIHGGGAAHHAWQNFGAVWGEGEGHFGQSYALPTMGTDRDTEAAAARFLDYARQHPELRFLLTPVGCGIAKKQPAEIAPLFEGAPGNVILPRVFAEIIEGDNQ